jgi:hypothetical protein
VLSADSQYPGCGVYFKSEFGFLGYGVLLEISYDSAGFLYFSVNDGIYVNLVIYERAILSFSLMSKLSTG